MGNLRQALREGFLFTNNDSNDVFGMQLMYDKADSALVNTKRYNGKPPIQARVCSAGLVRLCTRAPLTGPQDSFGVARYAGKALFDCYNKQ